MRHRFLTADVFTDTPFGGNQLAVFPDARGVPEARMQDVAREFNFSETVFVLPPDSPDHTRRLRIFTPGEELPFAGHPTIGAAHVLAATGEVPLDGDLTRIVFEEGVGPVRVSIRARGGVPVFAQLTAAKLPEFGPPPPAAADLARVVSLSAADVVDGFVDGSAPEASSVPRGVPASAESRSGVLTASTGSRSDIDVPAAVSCGVPFLFVPLRDRAALGRARLDLSAWAEVLEPFWASMVFLFCREPERPGSDLRARMFAPGQGIPEDPATGSAAAGLGLVLVAAGHAAADGETRFLIDQGVDMGRPSALSGRVEASRGAAVRSHVAGQVVPVSSGHIVVPPLA